MPAYPARILLVDDHELFREGLAGLVNAQPDLVVVGQASDGLEALTMARDVQPDLIIMDINMPICDGLEATRLIREALPEVRIVMLTVHDKDEKLFAAIKAGANGYMLKDTSATDFLRGVCGALGGEATLPPKLAASLVEAYARLATQPSHLIPAEDEPDLTGRELEVLYLVATGASNQEIAEQLSISLHTTKSHVRSILAKLHAVNRRQAARLAARRGLL
ncbi:MAG: response regulator transcription factor [Chloroflexi bacterium]|nr:response regulator transcription factor [Ardenticatenaceae bacterium]MBL1127848.1 DNA-binding response regulator [Chloroflexota bacterium]NOG33917.1 response regulator transcription factor [Chloroflexota bacterium]GIK55601.1 MAG: DNA-binding response regulator [Chloroflexota bacterium]